MRKKKTPALVNLAIYTTITIFLWMFFDIYRALKKEVVLDIDNKILEPVNPNLDKNLLDELDQSIYYDESLFENRPQATITPQVVETPVEENDISQASESASGEQIVP